MKQRVDPTPQTSIEPVPCPCIRKKRYKWLATFAEKEKKKRSTSFPSSSLSLLLLPVMDCFPSPPSSPSPYAYLDDLDDLDDPDYTPSQNEPAVVCGSCDKALGPDWFCSNCHMRCAICNRILVKDYKDAYCTRCWVYVPWQNVYMPTAYQLEQLQKRSSLPTPTTSTNSSGCSDDDQ